MISNSGVCAVILIGILKLSLVSSSNILFYHHFVTSSHRTAIWPLVEKLADKGHNITYIFPMHKKIGFHPNVEEIVPSKMVPLISSTVSEFDINIRLQGKEGEWMSMFLSTSVELCKAFYDSPEIVDWLARPGLRFDLIFIDGSLGECAYGLVYKFQAKLILLNTIISPFFVDGFGLVPESSSIPDYFSHPKPTEMTLVSRTISTLIPLLWRYKFLQYIDQIEPIVWEKLRFQSEDFSSPPVSLIEIESNVSLVLLNGYFIEEYPAALPPMFVSYSGLWCSKAKLQDRKPPPENVAKFIENSKGFFYVSFGSSVVASTMPVELRRQFFTAFRALPEYKFLWRWTGPIPEDTPDNALLLPWFPQHDLLAHPKIKGFLSQVGRPSTQEAICSGVPLIAVPIFGKKQYPGNIRFQMNFYSLIGWFPAEQDYNADRLEYIEVAIQLDIASMTTDILSNAFNELLNNPKWKANMQKMSAIFKDRPLDPLENALFWVEYVLRHDSTSLLKPLGLKQTWYQRRLWDVFAFLQVIALSIIGLIILVLVIFCKFTCKLLRRVNPKPDLEGKKMQ